MAKRSPIHVATTATLQSLEAWREICGSMINRKTTISNAIAELERIEASLAASDAGIEFTDDEE